MTQRIYTKTGDSGDTSLIGGTKVPKSHIRIESYGTVDELNSHIGLLLDHTGDEATRLALREVQDRLFTVGSSLACDPDKAPKMKLPDLHESDVVFLEEEMDRMNDMLEPMKSFILPGGSVAISVAHVARSVCRRAERHCVHMKEHGMFVAPLVIRYLNRLSDYLFIVARYIGKLTGVTDVPWKARLTPDKP